MTNNDDLEDLVKQELARATDAILNEAWGTTSAAMTSAQDSKGLTLDDLERAKRDIDMLTTHYVTDPDVPQGQGYFVKERLPWMPAFCIIHPDDLPRIQAVLTMPMKHLRDWQPGPDYLNSSLLSSDWAEFKPRYFAVKADTELKWKMR